VAKDSDTADGYDRVAGEYARRLSDELAAKPLDRALLAAFAEMAPDGPIADLGCGPGHVALFLHRLGRRVIGIDLSPGMIETARKLRPGPEFRVGNILRLDLDDGSLAGAVAFYSIIHLTFEELPTAFAELRRVLAPDGLALIAFHAGRHTVHRDEWWGHDVSIDFHFHPPEEVEKLLREADLEIDSSLLRQAGKGEVQTERSYLMARRSPITIRPATDADEPFLRALHHACYRAHVEEIWGWDEADQDQRFAASWSTTDRSVVELRAEPIGALQISRRADHIFVSDIEIHPQHQGGGIGTRLLRRVLAQADAEQVPVRLQVLRNNPARHLYERLGFAVEETTETRHVMQRPPRRRGGG
jgi:SAM-dependent methyltransferase